MTPDERRVLLDDGGKLRRVELRARPLPWASPEDFHAAEVAGEYEWTPEREDAVIHLLEQGHSLARICNQTGREWPRQSDVKRKSAKDPNFASRLKAAAAFGAGQAVDNFSEELQGVTSAQAPAAKLRMDYAFRVAAVRDPEQFGQKSQLGISGGLVLASGSLADLAAQAHAMHTKALDGGTDGANPALPSPDNQGETHDV